MPCVLWGFPFWVLGMWNIPRLVRSLESVSPVPFWGFIIQPWVVSLSTCDDKYSAKDPRGTLWRFQDLFLCLCAALLPILCPVNSSSLGLSSISSTQGTQWAVCQVPLLVLQPGNSIQTASWSNDRADLVLFPFLRYQCAVLPIVQYLKTIVLYTLPFFFFFPIWLHRTACGILVPRPGIEPGPSAVRVQSPNHWTAREFPFAHS